MSDWPSVPLASLVKSGRGISYGIVQPGIPQPDGIPVLRVTDIRNGSVDTRSPLRVAPHVEAAHARTRLAGGELLMTLVGTVGETAVVPDVLKDWNVARAIAVIPVDEGVGARWVKLALEAPAARELIKARLNTTVQATLNLRDVADLPVLMPAECERVAITAAICALDDKVELNRRMSQTLEAIAQAIFRSWFVDFEGATVEAEMRDSTLGAEVGRCGGLIQTGPFGSQLHAVDYAPSGVPVVMPQDIKGRRISHDRIARVSEAKARSLARHRLAVGDVVYSRRGDVERHALVGSREVGWLCGTGCLLVRPGPAWASQAYLSEWLDLPDTRTWLKQHAVGATMPNLNTGILAALPIRVPPSAAMAAFEERAGPLRESQSRLSMESEALGELRDTLLPRLLSGELTPTAA